MNKPHLNRVFVILVAATGIALISSACSKKEEPQTQFQQTPTVESTGSAEAGNPAPDFALQDVNGKDVSLADYKGNVIMVNFWATWCGPCKREIPDFVELQKTYGGKGLKIVGIALDDPSEVNAFVKNERLNYDVLIGTDEVAMRYGNIRSIPTTFLVDREGKIVSSYVGLQPKEKWVSEIESLL